MSASNDIAPSMVVSPALPILPSQTGKEGGMAGTLRRPEVKGADHVAAGLATDEAHPHGSPAERAASERSMQEAVQQVNEALEAFEATAVKLSYDRARELVVIQVVKGSNRPGEQEKVIRQFPPEELLRLAGTLEELRGVLYDQQV